MNRYSFFAGGEIYDDLYLFCFTVNGKFYCGERSIRLTTDELIRLINEHTGKLKYHPALVTGEPYNQYFRWYNREVKRTPYFFTDGQHMKPVSTLSSATGNKYDDNRNRRELAKYLRSLRSNCCAPIRAYNNYLCGRRLGKCSLKNLSPLAYLKGKLDRECSMPE